MKYEDYLESEHWLTLRYLKRLKQNRCGVCASKDNLDVHHLNYRHLYDVELKDLRVLCRRCHFLAHDLMKNGTLVFKNDNHHSRFAFSDGPRPENLVQ